MKNYSIFLLLIVFVCSSCNSCLGKLYSAHEPLTSLDIPYYKKINSISDFKTFIDSLNKENGLDTNCYKMGLKLNENEKVIKFSGSSCEHCIINIEEDKVSIKGVFVPTVNKEYWLFNEEQVDDSIKYRIGRRFSFEIFDKYHNK